MAFNDDNLRDHLRDTRTKVPDEFSWEAMQGGIMERIEQQTNTAAADRMRARRRYWWVVLPLLIGSSLVVAYRLGVSRQPAAAPASAQLPRYATGTTAAESQAGTSQAAAASSVATMPAALQAPTSPNTFVESKKSADAPTHNETNIKTTKNSAGKTATPEATNPTGNTSATAAEVANRSKTGDAAGVGGQQGAAQTSNEATATTGGIATNSGQSQETAPAADPVPTQPTIEGVAWLSASGIAPVTNVPAAHLSDIRVTSRMHGTPWRAVAAYGTAYALLPTEPKYALPQQVQASEKGLLSQYARMMIHRDVYRGLSVGVGGEWQQLNSQFDYQAKSPTSTFLQNVVLLRKVNAITRDTTNVTGDTTVNAIATRTVRHFNQSTAINIPVVAGYRMNVGRWVAGAELGVAFNLQTSYSGRTYNSSGQVVDIVSDGSMMKSRTGVSLLSGVQVGYRLLPRATVLWQLEAAKFLGNRSAEVGVTNRPMMFRTGVALQYRF